MGDYREDSTPSGARLQLSRDAEEKQQTQPANRKPETDTVPSTATDNVEAALTALASSAPARVLSPSELASASQTERV